MQLTHPLAPFQGIPAENIFFASNHQYVQMGMGMLICGMQAEMYPNAPAQFYVDIKAQPSARNLILGALLAKADQTRTLTNPQMQGRIYTELTPNQWDLINFYNRSGFVTEDAQEEYVFPLPEGKTQPPMGCSFASVPLSTPQEQQAFVQRLNRYRLNPITQDYLVLQMQQPYFLALGYYRGGFPIAEMMMTGASTEMAALVMVYVQSDLRRRGIAKSLIQAGSDLLREKNIKQAMTQIYSRAEGHKALMNSLGGNRRRILSVLPAIHF